MYPGVASPLGHLGIAQRPILSGMSVPNGKKTWRRIEGDRRFSTAGRSIMKTFHPKHVIALFFAFLMAAFAVEVEAETCVETTHLMACDMTQGQISSVKLNELANQVQQTLDQVLKFWSANARVEKLGKIWIEFDRPRGGIEAAQFYMSMRSGMKVRTVRVFGVENGSQNMIHKLTIAIFPSPDKLIRCMFGPEMEELYGNRQSFPMCGLSTDSWVLAIRRLGAYTPLAKIGPDHESWGMKMGRDGWPYVADAWKQHVVYAEAESFGKYLLHVYGTKKIRAFYQLSNQGKERHWEVFDSTLDDLEKNWVGYLGSIQASRAQEIETAVKLMARGAGKTCPSRLGD